MPRFYFHIRYPDRLVLDDEGIECRDLDSARHEALLSARDIARGSLQDRQSLTGWCIEIQDESGTIVGAADVRDAISNRML